MGTLSTNSEVSFLIYSETSIIRKRRDWPLTKKNYWQRSVPSKFCNRLLTEILTEVPISHSLTEFNQPSNR